MTVKKLLVTLAVVVLPGGLIAFASVVGYRAWVKRRKEKKP